MKKLSGKEFFNKILTGMSIGIVIALIPGALLGELAKALGLVQVVQITQMAQSMAAAIIGLCIALQFGLNPIQSGTLAITTTVGSGVIKINEGMMTLVGIGDVINVGIVAAITVYFLLLIGDRLKAYTILVVPAAIIVGVGFIGLTILPYVASVTGLVGSLVDKFTTFQPIIASILIAVTFAIMIISPVSTAGVALAISLAGIGSGAANLGICAAGFGLAIAGWKVNGVGTSLAHFFGSPKMQMANFVKNPKMILPIVLNAAVTGACASIFMIQGTPQSAGFGISGLIGPINHLNIVGWDVSKILIALLVFIVVPVIMGLVSTYLFSKVLKITTPEDYQISFN